MKILRPLSLAALPILTLVSGCTGHYRESLARYRAAEPSPFYQRTLAWAGAADATPEAAPMPAESIMPEASTTDAGERGATVAARVLGIEPDAFHERAAGLRDPETRDTALAGAIVWRDVRTAVALHNPRVEAARHEWLAALNQYSQAEYLEGLLREYKTFTRYLDTGAGEPLQKDMTREFFPYPSTLAYRGEMVREQVRLAELAWEQVLRDTLIEAGTVYFDYAFQFRGAATVETNVSLLQDLIQVVQDRYAAGLATQSDVLRLQVELERQRNMALDFQSRRRARAAGLNALLGRPAGAALGTPADTALSVETPDYEALVATALERRQEVLAQRSRVARTEIAIRMGEIMNRPLFSGGASTFERGVMPEASTGAPAGPFGTRPDASAPRPAYAQTEAYLAETRDRLAAERAALAAVELETRALARALLEEVDIAARQVALVRDVVLPLNQSAYEIGRNAYTVGTFTFLDLLDAERTLIDARLELDEGQRDLNQALIRLAGVRGSF